MRLTFCLWFKFTYFFSQFDICLNLLVYFLPCTVFKPVIEFIIFIIWLLKILHFLCLSRNVWLKIPLHTLWQREDRDHSRILAGSLSYWAPPLHSLLWQFPLILEAWKLDGYAWCPRCVMRLHGESHVYILSFPG